MHQGLPRKSSRESTGGPITIVIAVVDALEDALVSRNDKICAGDIQSCLSGERPRFGAITSEVAEVLADSLVVG